MKISEIAIERPVFTWMLMFALILFGYLSFQRMGVGQLPDVDQPVVSVNATLEGASPEVMETQVVDQIESAVLSIAGIRNIRSSARQGRADVTIEFNLEKNIDIAVQEVQAKLSEAQRRLPDDLDPPSVRKRNPEDRPILWLSVTSETMDRLTLMTFVRDRVRDQFSKIDGVAEVMMGGYLEPTLRVWVHADKLKTYALSVDDVIDAIKREHSEMPAGIVERKNEELSVRVLGEASSVKEFENLLITRRGGGINYRPVALKDIARIEEGTADVRSLSRADGKASIGLGILKQRGSNTVAVADRVKDRFESLQKELGSQVKLAVNYDGTVFVKEAVHELIFTLLLSALLTALVCWVFLGSWSSTLNIILAIPTSVVGSFMVLSYLNFTLNTFTLLALSLAIGIVVDDAIMVLENIFRHLEKGLDRKKAAIVGVREVSLAALAATAAIIAIFIPVAFMTGVIGRYFYEFGVTISVAVAISLLEALTLTPMRCAQFVTHTERTTRFGKAVDGFFESLRESYQRILPRILEYRWITIGLSLVAFALTLSSLFFLKSEFAPSQDDGRIMIRAQTKVGSSLSFTDEKVKELEAVLSKQPEVERVFLSIGGFGGGQVNTAMIFLTLKDYSKRPLREGERSIWSQQKFSTFLRGELKKVQGIQAFIQDNSSSSVMGHRGYPIEVSLKGPDWNEILKWSDVLQKKFEESGAMTDVNSDYIGAAPEIEISPNRDAAAQFGVGVADIARTINALVGGVVAGLYTKDGKRYDIRVRLEEIDRQKLTDLEKLPVRNSRGELIPLKSLVNINEGSAPLRISRVDRERALDISANVAPESSQSEALKTVERIAKETLPPGYYVSLGGSSQTFRESRDSLLFALLLGILVSYMVLASQFNSYIHPLTVLIAFPFGISGAFVALLLWGQTLNIYSMIGLILLAGLVKKNSILLVDFTNQMKAAGKSTHEALLEACPVRLRPILMTSFATIAAAIPAAVNFGPGAESRIPMAAAIIGGMILSTVLTLLVVPCVYSLLDKLQRD